VNHGAYSIQNLDELGNFFNEMLMAMDNRQELVQWLNSLLQLNMTKVEQCGTG
jgi:hypothetical protein